MVAKTTKATDESAGAEPLFTGKTEKAIIRLEIKGFPVELTVVNAESYLTPSMIKDTIESYVQNGFTAPPRFSKAGSSDNIGKMGTVKGHPVFDGEKKMWNYTAVLTDASEFKWNDFSRTAYRVGDVIRVIKNDRGFKTAEVLDPESKEVKEYLYSQPGEKPEDDEAF